MARMLLVEDNEMNSDLVKILVEASGHECVAVEDGPGAIASVETEKFDLILLDIQLPKMDGYAVLKELKRITPQTPVIAVSSYAMVGDAKRALDAGFDGYISKPIVAETFIAQVLQAAKLE